MRERPTMASHRLDLPSICDICGKGRSTRKHAACSRIRQQTKQEEWASYMANALDVFAESHDDAKQAIDYLAALLAVSDLAKQGASQ